jgi:cytoskeletal protein CcmA (bactofilin family)
MISKRFIPLLSLSVLITLIFIAVNPQPAQAAYLCIWTGAIDNTWNTPGNWTGCGGTIPQAADTASISSVAPNPTPVLNGSTTITRLDINPTGALIAVGGATLTANIINLNGRFTGPGELVVLNSFYWGGVYPVEWLNDGILDNGGKITIQAGAHGYISGYSEYYRMNNFTLVNHGILEPVAGYTYAYVVLNNAVIENYGTWAANGTYVDSANNSTIYNHLGATLQATNYTNIYTALLNDGIVNVVNTEAYICRGSTQTGEYKGSGTGFIFFGYCYEGAVVPTTFNFTSTSKITTPRVQFGLPGNTVNIHGTYGPLGTTTASYLYGTVTFFEDALITSFGNALNIYGLVTVNATTPSNQYDLLVQSPGKFVYAGTINIAHEMACYGGILSGGGLLRVQSTGVLRFSSCTLDAKQVENQGAIWWSGTSATITGQNSAVLNNVGTFNLGNGSLITGNLTLQNSGKISKNNDSTTTIDVPFEHTGTIEILLGKIVFAGDVTIPADTTNTINGTLKVGELINEGTLTVKGTVDGDLTNLGTLNLSGTVTGDLTNEGRMSPGTSPGLVVVNGNFSQTEAGSLKIELSKDGDTPVLNPIAGVDYDQVQVSGTSTLAGELYLVQGETLALISFQKFPFLISGSGVVNDFSTINTSDMLPEELWSLVYTSDGALVQLNGFVYLPTILR